MILSGGTSFKQRRDILPKRTPTSCLNCNKHFVSLTMYSKYCSQGCQREFQFNERLTAWLNTGKYFTNKTLRKFLTHLYGHKCAVCGISSWNDKPIVLEVEHIDGNSENCEKSNVCLICPNCHSQTPTYKGKNVGKGRHSRRMRYKQGLSY